MYADVYYCMDTEVLLYTLKQKMYMEALQKMLKKKIVISNYELERPLHISKNKKVIVFMKDK